MNLRESAVAADTKPIHELIHSVLAAAGYCVQQSGLKCEEVAERTIRVEIVIVVRDSRRSH